MSLLDELAGRLGPSAAPMAPAAAPPEAVYGNLIEALGATSPNPPLPLEAPRSVKVRDAVKDFTGNFLFALGQSLKASASAPGGRGTRAGMGAALEAPLVLQQMREEAARQQQADELKRAQFLSTLQQQGIQNALAQRTAETAQGNLQVNRQRALTEAERAAVDRKKTEAELSATKTTGFAPGTLIISKDSSGKEIGREIVPPAPTKPDQPKTTTTKEGVLQWIPDAKSVDGGTWKKIGDAPVTQGNPYLNALRELDLQNRENPAPGQIVYRSTGNTVPSDKIPEAAATKISSFNDLISQTDRVKLILDKLGETDAIKGYVLREGLYIPVVQDKITPDQAEAVSELYRLINSYVYAVSGKQINQAEFERISKTAPNILYKPGVNQRILENFKRYVTTGKENYLKVRGWKEQAETAETGTPGGLKLPEDIRKKLMEGR